MKLNGHCDHAGDLLLSPVQFDNVGEAGVLYLCSELLDSGFGKQISLGFFVNFIMVINKTNSNSKLLCVPDGKI